MPKFKDRTGETNIANNGQKMTIIAYRNCDDIDIQFEDGTIVYNKTHQLFKNGTVKNPNVHITEYGAYKGKAKKCVVFGVEYESFKKACETYGINDDNARAYRDKYKISDEKAIDHYVNGTDYSTTEKIHGTRINCNTKIVEIDGIRYNHKQAIQKFNLSQKGINKIMIEYKIEDKSDAIVFCVKNNLAKATRKQSSAITVRGIEFSGITTALKYFKISPKTFKKQLKELDTEDITYVLECMIQQKDKNTIKTNKGNFASFSKLLNYIGLSAATFHVHCANKDKESKLKVLTEIIDKAYIDKDGTLIIPDKIKLNIKKRTQLSEEELLDLNKFIKDCKSLGINSRIATRFRKEHPELTDKQIFDYYMTPSFTQKCNQAGVNASTASAYRHRHPELTDEQVIIHYRPDVYINIFGELIIPDTKED